MIKLKNSKIFKNITTKIDCGGYAVKKKLPCCYGNKTNVDVWQ